MSALDSLHYFTAEDAGKKLCPQELADKHCVGPECMAWRWEKRTGRTVFWRPNPMQPKPEPHWIKQYFNPENMHEDEQMFIEGPTKGYCGMVKV